MVGERAVHSCDWATDKVIRQQRGAASLAAQEGDAVAFTSHLAQKPNLLQSIFYTSSTKINSILIVGAGACTPIVTCSRQL